MEKLKVAVVGAGIYGRNHLNAYTWNPNSDLVAVCDMNNDDVIDLKDALLILKKALGISA